MAYKGRAFTEPRNPAGRLPVAPLRGPEEPTEFELQLRRLGLPATGSAAAWAASGALRAWVERWYRTKYVPENLLEEWGLEGL